MGKGRRFVCCCDSGQWCCVIYWLQGIFGALGILGSFSSLAVLINNPKTQDKYLVLLLLPTGDDEDTKLTLSEFRAIYLSLVIKNIVDSFLSVGLSILLFCGINQRSSRMMKTYVVCFITLEALLFIADLVLVILSKDFVLIALILVPQILFFLVVIFVVWVVDVHRKEICFNTGQETGPVVHNMNEGAWNWNYYPMPMAPMPAPILYTNQNQSPAPTTAVANTALTSPPPVQTDAPS